MADPIILKVAVPVPLPGLFDYLPPDGVSTASLRPGCRLRVPFGSKVLVGVLMQLTAHSDLPRRRLKAARALLDTEPVLPPGLLRLVSWAAAYYQHPVGEVMEAALPALLRAGRPVFQPQTVYLATTAGMQTDLHQMGHRAPRQAQLLAAIRQAASGLSRADVAATAGDWRGALGKLLQKGLCEAVSRHPNCSAPPVASSPTAGPTLTAAQQQAVAAIGAQLGSYATFLLDGVTGSGKTEVYLQVISAVLAKDRQALLLVPEIGLTPQLLARFQKRFAVPMAVLHSALSDKERLDAWRRAASGQARLVIGTRSAIFAALPAPGLIVVDEEHDASFKQQDGFRYSARDLAVLRGRHENIPVILGSATPCLETIHNASKRRYRHLVLPERPGSATHPEMRIIDLRAHAAQHGLSTPLVAAIGKHLDAGSQVLLFLNRRGYAPALFCSGCGWIAPCDRCDARMTLHRARERLRCHHCGRESRVPAHCGNCGEALKALGQGTERMEETLQSLFPGTAVARIDRDSTQRRGSMHRLLEDVHAGRTQILVGTQMLTKGHHFPGVTLVGVLNADQGLFGSDFRANERFAQTLVQVAGRAGRADRPGEVLIQTAYPEHPLLQRLVTEGYTAFAAAALDERRQAQWPPYSHLALLRAEAAARDAPLQFLTHAAKLARQIRGGGVTVLGPAPAPMEKRAGRYRAQLLLQSAKREPLQQLLRSWRASLGELPGARRVRWSLDVDPLELF